MEKKYSYNAIHLWLHYHFGHALECEKCGEKGIKTGRRWSIEWALKPGFEFVRVVIGNRIMLFLQKCKRTLKKDI